MQIAVKHSLQLYDPNDTMQAEASAWGQEVAHRLFCCAPSTDIRMRMAEGPLPLTKPTWPRWGERLSNLVAIPAIARCLKSRALIAPWPKRRPLVSQRLVASWLTDRLSALTIETARADSIRGRHSPVSGLR